MADLVSGRFPQLNPWALFYGTNTVNGSYPARSNAEYLGLSDLTDTAIATTGVLTAVPIPIDPGAVVSKVNILTGATAASLPTHSFGALYTSASTPALIGQSTDGTSVTAFTASTIVSFTLTTAQQITAAQSTGGYIWAAFSVTATTMPTVSVVSEPTAAFASTAALVTGGPLYLASGSGS